MDSAQIRNTLNNKSVPGGKCFVLICCGGASMEQYDQVIIIIKYQVLTLLVYTNIFVNILSFLFWKI